MGTREKMLTISTISLAEETMYTINQIHESQYFAAREAFASTRIFFTPSRLLRVQMPRKAVVFMSRPRPGGASTGESNILASSGLGNSKTTARPEKSPP